LVREEGVLRLNRLLIDTSNEIELVSAAGDNRVYETAEVVKKSHSATLFSNIQRVLEDAGLTIGDIRLLGVGIGPGSFTGIRIAVSTARMLAQLLKIPLVGIKTQLIYASSVNALEGENILVAFDAKKQRVFGALYRRGKSLRENREIVPPGDYPMDYLAERADKDYRTHLAGNGTIKYREIIKEKLKDPIYSEDFLPSGRTALEIIEEEYAENPGFYNRIANTLPFYARKSDAELG
jgi:tRNA threonylcarbamoyladenosine biosynthesis protein TsaB